MKGKFWLIAAFAMMLAACSKDSGTIDSPVPSEQGNKTVGSTQQPVSFGAYLNRAVTRAGYEGNLGIDQLKTNGFGVLAYYTDDKTYSPDFQPNFMYNTKVAYQTDHWEYNPVRYWPNENSEHDASEGLDRLSFFAYAPHVDVNQLTGYTDENDNPDVGIVALSRNGAIGDPFVYYHVNFNPASQVDFCWGTPRVNMTKQATNQKVEFEFNHALAALNVQIDADIDEAVADASTHIYVRSVSFEGFAERGAFNLNTQPGQVMWHNMTGDDYLDGGKVTVHDGRVNGNEGAAEAVNELPKGLNPVLVQSAKYGDAALTDGVTATAVNLFGENESIDAPVYVIPTGQPLKLTIVYDVETQADKLPGYLSDGVTHGTSIENRITKTIALTSGETMRMEAGKHYILNLHLGMTSVKLNATISDWSDGGSGNADLPVNTTIPVAVESISINDPTPYTLIAETDQTLQLSVTVSPNDATNKNVIWSSSDTNIATIDENGIITPVSAGTVTITATAEEDESIKDAIDITVTPYPHATGVSVNPAGFSLQIGNTKNLAAVVSPDEALNKAVTWSSSNPSVASVDSNGKVTAISEGNAVITATTEDGGFTATSQVMVYTERTMIISKSSKPNPNTVVNYYFEYLKNRIPNGTFTVTSDSPWSSSDETVVAVNEATDMLTPLKHGTTTLTVTSDDGRSNSVKLIVIIPAITLNVIETDVRMSVGEDPRQLNASVGPADADIQTVTWSSSDESVATVDASGKVTAVAPGTAIITATLDQSGILDGLAGEPMQSLSTYYDNEITATTNVTVTAVATLSDLAKLSKDALEGNLTADQAEEYLGKYVMQDGSFKDFADLAAAKTGGAVGAVAYISTDGTDVDAAIPGSRVLVLAVLEKVNNSYDYYGQWTTVLNSDKEGYALGYEYGSNSSYKLLNKAWTYQNGWGQSNHGTDGKGHWFLPSKTQMEKMGAIENNRTGVWAKLAGNNMSYESSTRNNDLRYSYNSYSHWTSLGYTFGAYIHPVFAY